MPQQRGREHHRNRVAETLREELAVIIEGELSDPRVGSVHVTEVVLAPGGKSGQVYVSVLGDEQQEEQTLDGLLAARGYIRAELLERMGVRRIPDLTFHIDRSEKIGERMDTLLHRIKKRSRKAETATAP
ncbi:30S ribosome-binding factor RbfA [Terriglobus aquaticus]|uniref:Ribosome-binding factor A n=1 Tax=Terriglobus aquaticus TaxID=940139 RepID=A0ABW9KMU0_9BACT|nr:30S ribosome-binding factor RbfA [Terriglobus aquaticus]